MKEEKVKSYLGFAIKSRAAVFGLDSIGKKKVLLVLADTSLQPSSMSKLESLSNKNGFRVYKVSLDAVKQVLPSENIKVIGISNKDLANAIEESL